MLAVGGWPGPAGYVVIDIDVKDGKQGSNSWSKFPDIKTYSVVTESGGRHLWFELPEGVEIGGSHDLGPGIDVRSKNGYVILPGQGGYSEMLDTSWPPEKAPGWLLDRLNPPGAELELVPPPSVSVMSGAVDRSTELFKMIVNWADAGVPQETVLEWVRGHEYADHYKSDEHLWQDICRIYDKSGAVVDVVVRDVGNIGSMFVDWSEFFTKDRSLGDDWTVSDFLARGRGHAIFASGKTGKSEIVLSQVVERITDPGNTDVCIYLDYEMGDDDLYQRLVEDFGYDAGTDFGRLLYAQLPKIPPLDTDAGAQFLDRMLSWVKGQHPGSHVIVIIDTIGRAVQGKESDNDTTLNFYRHSGLVLKRHETTWARLDHKGHGDRSTARGGSAKADDVDVVWELKRSEVGSDLVRRAARMSWVPEVVPFIRHTDPVVRYEREILTWSTKAKSLADLMDSLGVDLDASRAVARSMITNSGQTPGRNEVISEALKYRKWVGDSLGDSLKPDSGDSLGDSPPSTPSDQGGQ